MSSNSTSFEINRPISSLQAQTDELTDFRNLLLGPVLENEAAIDAHLKRVQEQLNVLDKRTEDYSQVLAASIRRLHDQNKNLNSELEPEVTSGIYKCFNTQPERMAEVLYPILGPAVRKLVASLFQGDAGHKGKPFQVEQIFLIHKETSVVLSHCVLCDDAARDADLVSGMLDAIRSFVQEAFALSEFDGMNSINLGDLTIWVEWGPKAILAVVVRGIPDEILQDHYAEVLRLLHERHRISFDSFDGDTAIFDSVDLSSIETGIAPDLPQAKTRGPVIGFTHIAAAVVVFMVVTANVVSDKRAWQFALNKLADEPGIVVIDEKRGWRHSTLSILRDPLASAQKQVLALAGIDEQDVAVSWHQFQSKDPVIQHRRDGLNRSSSALHQSDHGQTSAYFVKDGLAP